MRKWIALLSVALMTTSITIPSYGAWLQQGSQWIYEDNQVHVSNTWKPIDGVWYYFDQSGHMATGWQLINSKWYFLNPISDGFKGKMLTGWQWIDEKCYFLSSGAEQGYTEGEMYDNGMTPDGYSVDASGAWTQEGRVVEISGKGIQTVGAKKTTSVRTVFSGGGGGSGGSGGGGRGHSGKNEENPDVKPEPVTPTIPNPGANNGGNETPVVPDKQYKYTVRYMDIVDKTTLQVLTGTGKGGETIQLIQPDIDGYKICKGQKESLTLDTDQITITIYYEKETPASPSEARKIDWDLKFIEEGKPNKEIFKGQKGQTEEGKELVIDFPETIIGTDKFYYHSLVSSPWSVEVNGNGIQKYYIEFRKGDQLPEEPDPDTDSKEKLNKWLEIAKDADYSITGEYPTDAQIITSSQSDGNERLLNLVSMTDGTDRKEIYLIARGYYPNAAIISQKFQAVKNISELAMEELKIASNTYTILRIGFEKTYVESLCSHDYEVINEVAATCTENGHQTVRCKKCGKEETIISTAIGHVDADHDGICDICYEPSDEVPEAVHYRIGDRQIRIIDEKPYIFRCIDDDFEDALGNSQKLALFLCDSVIRSDIRGASKKINFGDNNNYKYSKVREWLLENAKADFVHETYIGITNSYMGATSTGAYEQFSESSLLGQSRLFQQLEDRVFILSVDEAIKYKDYLWKFNGSEENNPESQVSAYSKGYYLRSPQDSGIYDFRYGTGIYTVGLIDGNIRPVEVSETSIGIRPVMAIPQGE